MHVSLYLLQTALGNEILAIFNSGLDFLANVWSGLLSGIQNLISGVADLAVGLYEDFKEIFSEETWEKAGEAILEGLEDLGYAINDAVLGSIGLSNKESSTTVETVTEESDDNPDQ